MDIIRDIDSLKLKNTIVTLGKFDGNHLGHTLLFDTAIRLKMPGMKTVIFTFDIHPAAVIRDDVLRTIQTQGEKEQYHYPDGIDYVVEFPFNKETMSMEPETFIRDILVDKLDVKVIVVGRDFCFGKNRSGNVQTLLSLGEKYGFTVNALEKLKFKPSDKSEFVEISSTLIKEEILNGNMEDVWKMLGRPFCITGEVLHGKHLGSQIGFPTINMMVPDDKILPPDGVYATKTRIEGEEYLSITNVGRRPTFEDGDFRTIETNLFDFDGDLYGKTAAVDFYRFIRPEKKFADVSELTQEIAANKLAVLAYFHKNEN